MPTVGKKACDDGNDCPAHASLVSPGVHSSDLSCCGRGSISPFLAGIVMLMILPKSMSASVQEALAWIAGSLTYLGIAGRSMINCDRQIIAARAARLDDSRMVILAIVLLAIASSFVSIAGLINEAKEAAKHVKLWYLGLASATIVVSWCRDASCLHAALRARILSAAEAVIGQAARQPSGRSCMAGSTFPASQTPTIGISSILRLRSARPRKPPTWRYARARSAGW